MTDQLIYLKDLISEPGATGIASNYQDRTDPKYVGPGTWNVIHQRAYDARTHKLQIGFIKLMKDICYKFPCSHCRGHCSSYIKNHPIEEYLDVMVEIEGQRIALGMFVWAWKFHNAVNTRLKKPIMSWETAYNLYSSKESLVCSKNCLEAAGAPSEVTESSSKVVVPQVTVPKVPVPIPKPTNKSFRLISVDRK